MNMCVWVMALPRQPLYLTGCDLMGRWPKDGKCPWCGLVVKFAEAQT
jgi:hypothetical protein